MKAYMESPSETLKRLGTSREYGLTEKEAADSRSRHGANCFTEEKPELLVKRIFEAASEPMIIMLILAAVITLGVNIARYYTGGEADFFECAGIFAAISLSCLITVVMEGRSAKAFETLKKIGDDASVKVLRDGAVCLIARKEIVVGDILFVETGDKLAADGRILEETALTADESALTGESMPVKKDAGAVFTDEKTPVADRVNMLYSGCFITGGSGKAVVTAVGDKTEFGKIAQELSATDHSTTPLQEKMARLGKSITIMGSAAAAVVFLLQVGLFIYNGTASLDTVSEAFITSIVLIVAAVPEGLPTIVAVSLAVNIIKMSKQNALVKKMIACETIGCINVVCSDKTGTLTENRMAVKAFYSEGELTQPEKLRSREFLNNICINSTADVHFLKDGPEFIGNPTECALLAAAEKSGVSYEALRKSAGIIHVFPFNSEEKMMTTVSRETSGLAVYAKGSPEKIISLCSMSAEERKKAEREIEAFQEKACRVIGFAHRIFSETDMPEGMDAAYFEENRRAIESELIFDGFAAISDPLRSEVYEAVRKCRAAGISLKMLTGDNIVTARAIADELHMMENGCRAVEAGEIEEMTDEELERELSDISVIARSTPGIKMRVVNALKAAGNVVAVTGDGINDAPAIKNADVGIAMGISGTEVSKQASDIVLLDDSFFTIIKAVQWGRGIYENFQRFIQFQLTVNLSSVIVVLASILAGFEAPFSALELLWINIIMDGPPALTLGLEPIRQDLMEEQPTKRNSSIISCGMLKRIAVNGVFISAVFMGQHMTNFLGGTEEQLPTILFTVFVVFQLFNAFNSRELGSTSAFKNAGKNRLMLGVFALTFFLQVMITQFGGAFFGTVPLTAELWIKIVLLGASVVVVAETIKLAERTVLRKQEMKIKEIKAERV